MVRQFGMTQNLLLKLRPWLTVSQAAQQPAAIIGEPLTEADVLGLALDGNLTLSVNLLEETSADWEDAAGLTQVEPISGLWDLPMVPPLSLAIAWRYNELCGLPPIRMGEIIGALVERPGMRRRLRAEVIPPKS